MQILVNEGEAVSNDLLRGRVDGVKVGENPEGDEDVKLSGAVMGLFRPDTEEFTGENALLTVTTAEDGSFSFENIPYGHWIVKEISSPALYTVSPQQHHIYIGVDGQSIEIKVENAPIPVLTDRGISRKLHRACFVYYGLNSVTRKLS